MIWNRWSRARARGSEQLLEGFGRTACRSGRQLQGLSRLPAPSGRPDAWAGVRVLWESAVGRVVRRQRCAGSPARSAAGPARAPAVSPENSRICTGRTGSPSGTARSSRAPARAASAPCRPTTSSPLAGREKKEQGAVLQPGRTLKNGRGETPGQSRESSTPARRASESGPERLALPYRAPSLVLQCT